MADRIQLPTPDMLAALREMLRQWTAQGRQLNPPGRLSSSSGHGASAPIVQAIEVTSSTADAYGYPARIQIYDGTNWSDEYAEVRAVQIGSTIAGAVLATGFYPPGRLMGVSPTGLHIYGVHPGAAAVAANPIDISGRTGSVADVTAAQFQFAVVSGTAGATVITPDLASATLTGVVGVLPTATQRLGSGEKEADSLVSRGVDNVTSGYGITSLAQGVLSIGGGVTAADALPATWTRRIGIAESGYTGTTDFPSIFATGPANIDDNFLYLIFDSDDDVGAVGPRDGRLILASLNVSSTLNNPRYCVYNQITDVIHEGVNGTGGGGDTFTGGIATALSSGPTSVANVTTGTLAIANGGTGATTAAGARTNLGLGTMAQENIGATGTFTTVDGKTVTVTNGVIVSIV